jgi:hypothetical protein
MEGKFPAGELVGMTPNKINMPNIIIPKPTRIYPFLVEPKFLSAQGIGPKASTI